MPPRATRAPWVHPADDPTLNQDGFIPQSDSDPRTSGDGPCGALHALPLDHTADGAPPNIKFDGNQYGRWGDCAVCGLRLAFWPKEAFHGRYRQSENPAIVRTAIDMLRDSGDWNACSKEKMKAYIRKAEAEQSLRGQRATEERAVPKAKAKAKYRAQPAQQPPAPMRVAPRRAPSTAGTPTQAGTSRAPSPAPSFGDTVSGMVFPDNNTAWPEEEEDERLTMQELRAQIREMQRENANLRRQQEVNTAEAPPEGLATAAASSSTAAAAAAPVAAAPDPS